MKRITYTSLSTRNHYSQPEIIITSSKIRVFPRWANRIVTERAVRSRFLSDPEALTVSGDGLVVEGGA